MIDTTLFLGKLAVSAVVNLNYYSLKPEKIPAIFVYEFPKMAVESVTSATFWGARKIFNVCTGEKPKEPPPVNPFVPQNSFESAALNAYRFSYQSTAEGLKPDFSVETDIKESSDLQKVYDSVALQANKLSLQLTGWVTGKSVEELEKLKATADQVGFETSNFKAIDLIGPGLLLSLCVTKAFSNLAAATHHAKLLLSNQRMVSTAFQSPSLNSSTIATVEKTRRYTAARLFKDTAMETIFTALWSTGAYFTYHAIYDAVLDAAKNHSETQAKFIANTILTAGIVGPIIYGWIEEAIYMPSIETKHKSTQIAPHLVYSDPLENSMEEIDTAETLSHEQKLAYLQKYRPVPVAFDSQGG